MFQYLYCLLHHHKLHNVIDDKEQYRIHLCSGSVQHERSSNWHFLHCINFILCSWATTSPLLKIKIKPLDNSRVGIWFNLTTLVLGVVSSVLLVCVIRWYKARERDEIVNYQAMVEEIHYKYSATRSTPTTIMLVVGHD